MTKHYAYTSETTSQHVSIRRDELKKQHWNRLQSQILAKAEGFALNDEHWAVIKFLRHTYLYEGIPRNARTLSLKLSNEFSSKGGSKYLHSLFSGGPVTQGSRIANINSPACCKDSSFGTTF